MLCNFLVGNSSGLSLVLHSELSTLVSEYSTSYCVKPPASAQNWKGILVIAQPLERQRWRTFIFIGSFAFQWMFHSAYTWLYCNGLINWIFWCLRLFPVVFLFCAMFSIKFRSDSNLQTLLLGSVFQALSNK